MHVTIQSGIKVAIPSGLARLYKENIMILKNATVHFMPLENGEKVKYFRLRYRAGRATIGRSVLASRCGPEFTAKVEALSQS